MNQQLENFPKRQHQAPVRFIGKFYQAFTEEIIAIFYNLFQKIETVGTLFNPFYEASISIISKPYKDIQENQKPISLYLSRTQLMKS